MNSGKNWSVKEDQALLTLYKDRNYRKWTQISQLLYKQYGIKGKTPKKCRERFKNHLDPAINKAQWTPEEQASLMALQASLGNKWAQISRMIPGRTDDAIKNKFFSKFRKAIRNINVLRSQTKNLRIKELKIPFLYKLINFVDKTSRAQGTPNEELRLIAQDIKSIIISYEEIDSYKQQTAIEELQDLQQKIQLFNDRLKSSAGKRRGRKASVTNRNTAFKQSSLKRITAQQEIVPFQLASTPKKEGQSIQLNIGAGRLSTLHPFLPNTRLDEELDLKQGDLYKAFLQREDQSEEQYDVWKTPLYGIHHSSQYLD